MEFQLFFLCFFIIINFVHGHGLCTRSRIIPFNLPFRGIHEPFHLPMIRFGGSHQWRFSPFAQTHYRSQIEYYCCEGYEGVPGNCKPICENACNGNGLCFSPNICLCKNSYTGKYCEKPICENCNNEENSYCFTPGICRCKDGYASNDTIISSANCFPINEPKCKEQGQCTDISDYTSNKPETSPSLDYQSKTTFIQRRSITFTTATPTPTTTTTTSTTATPTTTTSTTVTPTTTTTTATSTTTTTTTTKVPLIDIPLSNCTDNCQCWTEYDDMGAISNTKCIQTCSKTVNSQHCLNLTYCHCYQPNGLLICKEEDDDEIFDQLQYNCTIRKSVEDNPEKLRSSMNENESAQKSNWSIIVGTIFIICGIISIAGALIYKKGFCFKRTNVNIDEQPFIDENL